MDERKCRVCGCTDERACSGGCAWVKGEPDLCTLCVNVERITQRIVTAQEVAARYGHDAPGGNDEQLLSLAAQGLLELVDAAPDGHMRYRITPAGVRHAEDILRRYGVTVEYRDR